MATVDKRHRFMLVDEMTGATFFPYKTENGVPDRGMIRKALREVIADLKSVGRADNSASTWMTGNPAQDRAIATIVAWELHKALQDDIDGEARMLEAFSEMSPADIEALGLSHLIDEVEAELNADAEDEAREYREEFLPQLRRIVEEAVERFTATNKAARRAMGLGGEELCRPRGPRDDTPIWATGGAAPATSPEEDMPDDKLRQRSGAGFGFPTADGTRPAWNRKRGK